MSCQLDICGNVTTILTIAAAASGWLAVHWLNSSRDRKNAERLTRVKELEIAHHVLIRSVLDGALTKASAAGEVGWKNKEVEDAISTVYLYGSLEQAGLARSYVDQLAFTGKGSLDALIDSIRNDIRVSLGLRNLKGPLSYLQLNIK
jgi:hypothetical protein